ncbi:hypothetical protein J5X84_11520 [Streptosporangiaceae bacterium NEAU-GS5]|nr:hypothetical protein [Streptosporangiaceae bacterium NEAU-GS5]
MDEPVTHHPTVVRALSARFPHWTIWWGQATAHYWGVCRRGQLMMHVEAPSAQEFVRLAQEADARRARAGD